MGAVALAETAILVGLGLILLLVLALPFLIKAVEHNLEAFLFVMGLGAAAVSGALNAELAATALHEPLLITGAVLAAGLLFRALRRQLVTGVRWLTRVLPLSVISFILVLVLGLASSVITAIIASLILVEILGDMDLDRRNQVRLAVVACFSIGLGAALTPVGEPLATIAASKLGADFWFLARLIGPYVVPGVLAMALLAAFFVRRPAGAGGDAARDAVREKTAPSDGGGPPLHEAEKAPGHVEESLSDVFVRAAKVFVFVMALVLLGEGFKPAIDRFVLGLPAAALYWINMLSAVLDNATLTAAEISVKMSPVQVKSILIGLLVSGGMLIPGNIPNIISAGRLKIESREWAVLGVPIGLAVMATYFVILFL